jgi:hypothetical protein
MNKFMKKCPCMDDSLAGDISTFLAIVILVAA